MTDKERPLQLSAGRLAKELRELKDPQKAAFFPRFFKCAPGEYGAGDRFLGVTVPQVRQVVSRYRGLSRVEISRLLSSQWHEERLAALLIMVEQFERGDAGQQKALFTLYQTHIKHINNWDLVDCSAPKIVGAYLHDRSRELLYRLAVSPKLWRRRIAIIATFAFIRNEDFVDTLAIAAILLKDSEDLIHKAVGWMLREVGKRDEGTLLRFLDRHAFVMPRTMLRYALEKLSARQKQHFMADGR